MKHFILLLISAAFTLNVSSQTNKQNDIAAIKASRLASNEAFANQNPSDIGKNMLDEFIAVWASGSTSIGKDSVVARSKRWFDKTPGLTYVRTPKEIIISDVDTLAFETGKWIGLKTKDKNPKWIGGKYSAMWCKRNSVWKLRSELFVLLKHY